MPGKTVWAIDFEYRQADLCGELPEIRCCCLAELDTGRTIRLWADQLGTEPPIDFENVILLAHNWGAEYGCFKKLGWPDPGYPVDTMQEVDRLCNTAGQKYRPTSLKRLMAAEGLPPIEEKEEMRFLAMENRRSCDYSQSERIALMDYCMEDTTALLNVWASIQARIMTFMPNEPQAFFWAHQRARYVFCCTDMDLAGIPINQELFDTLVEKQPQIHAGLHQRLKSRYGCSDGVAHFKMAGLRSYIAENSIAWPKTLTGLPKMDSDTLKRIANEYSELRELVEIFKTLRKVKVGNLNVSGSRCYSKIWPFAQSGTRNSVNKNFLFAAARWMRGLIKPEPGTGIAYLDFGREEILIQAVLANCPGYLEAYYSEDVHTENGKNFGLITDNMQKEDLKAARHLAKTAGFMIQYGGSAYGLSESLGITRGEADGIIRAYKRNYPEIGAWRRRVESTAAALRYLLSPDGSVLKLKESFNSNAACNFPIQATGGAILRLAQINLRAKGVKMLAPIHDAILVEYRLNQEKEIIELCHYEMVEAGKVFLNGYELLVDVESQVNYPESFPPGDSRVWDLVMELAGVS